MVERWGGSIIFGDLLEGGWRFFTFLLKGVEISPHWLRKTFYIKRRGVKFFHFYTWGGQQIFCSSERGVQNFSHVILNSTTPYCWVINDQPLWWRGCGGFDSFFNHFLSMCGTFSICQKVKYPKSVYSCGIDYAKYITIFIVLWLGIIRRSYKKLKKKLPFLLILNSHFQYLETFFNVSFKENTSLNKVYIDMGRYKM